MIKRRERLKSIKDQCIAYSDRLREVRPGVLIESPSFYDEDLSGIDLSGLFLTRIRFINCILKRAKFSSAVVDRADFGDSNLAEANFKGAFLQSADFRKCRLHNANFEGARMRGANLVGADLQCANLKKASLTDVIFRDAILDGAHLEGAMLPDFSIVPAGGGIIAFKVVVGLHPLVPRIIAKLLIPEDALRTSSLVGRKCRANKAVVLGFYTVEGEEIVTDVTGISYAELGVIPWREEDNPETNLRGRTSYKKGQTVYSDSFDDDIRVECTNGIHFFMTFKEAAEY